jgi:hypothetical protein
MGKNKNYLKIKQGICLENCTRFLETKRLLATKEWGKKKI